MARIPVACPHCDGQWDEIVPGWQPIETAPNSTDILLSAKPEGDLRWKYGVGHYIAYFGGRVLADWDWMFPPSHWKLLEPPE